MCVSTLFGPYVARWAGEAQGRVGLACKAAYLPRLRGGHCWD